MNDPHNVFEIKFLFVYLSGANTPKMVHPAICPCVTPSINLSKGGKSMHTPGAQLSKSMHPAAKMCTQGAGCTLNFEHCRIMCTFIIIIMLTRIPTICDTLSFS